jgi:hypothetical protein
MCALVLALVACGAAQVVPPPSLDGVDGIKLLAWQDALGPAYPLTITGTDSIATVTRFFDPGAAQWRDTSAFPGTPILAGFYAGNELRAEYGFVETSHGQGGYLVNRGGARIRLRAASPADITRFLAYFGLTVSIEQH